MQPFSVILLIYIVYLFVHYKRISDIYIRLLSATIFVEIFINIGYFVKIGSYEFMYSEVLIIILGMLSAFILLKYPVKIKPLYKGGILIFASLISTILLVINPFDYSVIKNRAVWVYSFLNISANPEFTSQTIAFQIRIILYVIIALATTRIIDKNNINRLVNSFQKYGKVVLLIGIFEFISKNIFKSNILYSVLAFIFGEGSSTLNKLLLRNNIYTIQALNREPNHFTSALFWLGITFIYTNKYNKKNKYYLLAIMALMLISGSLASVIFSAALIAIYSIKTRKKLSVVLLSFIGVTILVQFIDLTYYFNRIVSIQYLFEAGGNIDLSSSEHIRIGGIIENLKILQYRPLFGIGLGTIYTHAALPTILSNLGLLGTLAWFDFNFNGITNTRISTQTISLITVFVVVFILNLNSGLLYSMGLLLSLLCIKYSNVLKPNSLSSSIPIINESDGLKEGS